MSASNGFSYRDRLHAAGEFQLVFKGGKRRRCDPFILYRYPVSTPARLGIAASRATGTAVVRNRAKRLVREAFRQYKARLTPGNYVMRVAKPLAAYSNEELRAALEVVFAAARRA